jgi:protein YIPF5/7
MQFSYIYGMGVVGCLGMFMLLNLMSVHSISLHDTTSILGYCLLPVAFLAALGIVISISYVLASLLLGCWYSLSTNHEASL